MLTVEGHEVYSVDDPIVSLATPWDELVQHSAFNGVSAEKIAEAKVQYEKMQADAGIRNVPAIYNVLGTVVVEEDDGELVVYGSVEDNDEDLPWFPFQFVPQQP